MLFQALSAKLGIVTGQNLAELSRDRFPQPVPLLMWMASEVAAMATDLAEFLGGAIGLSLLTGVSLFSGMAAIAIITYAILVLGGANFRRIELGIGAFVAVIGICYLIELFIAPVSWGAAAHGMLTPQIPDGGCPVASWWASSAPPSCRTPFTCIPRSPNRAPCCFRTRSGPGCCGFPIAEVIAALSVAGAINMAMVMMAAAAFNAGYPEVGEIETAYHTLTPLLGAAAAAVFLVSLIASGISSSVVGTMAGQVILQGFFRRKLPIWLRRLVTMIPALLWRVWGSVRRKRLS